MQNGLCFLIVLAGDSRVLKNRNVESSYTQGLFRQEVSIYNIIYTILLNRKFWIFSHVCFCYLPLCTNTCSRKLICKHIFAFDYRLGKFSRTDTKLCQQFVKLIITSYFLILGEINGHRIFKILYAS